MRRRRDPDDEEIDLLTLAGAMARGEVDGYQGVTADALVRELVDTVGGALLMAADTFEDMERMHRTIGRELVADACKVAKEHARAVLLRLEPPPAENPREKGDDDGVEYGHPGDYKRGIE